MSSPLGHHFIVGLSASTLGTEEKRALAELRPSGIILFKYNFSEGSDWPQKLSELIESAKEASGRKKFIVSIDHEGGKVHRLKNPVTKFPAACCWGEKSEAVGKGMGQELASLGINLNFAPVLDIHSEESNPIIGDRAFAKTANEVSTSAKKFLKAMEAQGVMGCGKHFPGHGDTQTDSHLELPVLNWSMDELKERELVPFVALIEAGLEMLMTAHVLYPKLDPDNPATLSKKIITDILREQLNYKGLVISDALEMKALKQGNRVKNILKALNAGVDFLLMAQSENSLPVLEASKAANEISNSPQKITADLESSKKRIEQWLLKLDSKDKAGFSIEDCSKNNLELCEEILRKSKLGLKKKLTNPG